MPDTPVPSAATETSLETRVATAIWGYVDDYGIGRAHEVIALVRAEVACEIEAWPTPRTSETHARGFRDGLTYAAAIARGESR